MGRRLGPDVVLAELDVRHTRRHMSTRRVALGSSVLPMRGVAYGGVLLGCVAAANVDGLDEEQRAALDSLLRDAADGLRLPKRALRFRLQTDVEGLGQSRHRLVGTDGALVLELDVHAAYAAPQVLGAVMAASSMPSYLRRQGLRSIERGVNLPGVIPEGIDVRYVTEARPGPRGAPIDPRILGRRSARGTGPDPWRGVAQEHRWAMEVLGFAPGPLPVREEVQRRFRRLLRVAHPDHGGSSTGAAARIDELGEARRVLLVAAAVRGDGARDAG